MLHDSSVVLTSPLRPRTESKVPAEERLGTTRRAFRHPLETGTKSRGAVPKLISILDLEWPGFNEGSEELYEGHKTQDLSVKDRGGILTHFQNLSDEDIKLRLASFKGRDVKGRTRQLEHLRSDFTNASRGSLSAKGAYAVVKLLRRCLHWIRPCSFA